MTFHLYPVVGVEGDEAFAAIVDDETRAVWTLTSAGGSPSPMVQADREYIDENDISNPADLVGVVVRNMLVAAGEPTMFDDFPSALTSADQLLYEAQGGREPRTDLPIDVVSAIAQLEVDAQEVEKHLVSVMEDLNSRLEAVRRVLTRRIKLPHRFISTVNESDLDSTDGDVLARLDDIDEALLTSLDPGEPQESSMLKPQVYDAEDASGIRHFDNRTPIEELGLSKRVAGRLHAAGIATLGGLLKKTERSLKGIDGFGPGALEEVTSCLQGLGLTLKQPKNPAASEAIVPRALRSSGRMPTGFAAGVVKNFLDRGYGFIQPTSGEADLFFHASVVRNMPADDSLIGRTISFKRGAGRDGRAQADEVLPWE